MNKIEVYVENWKLKLLKKINKYSKLLNHSEYTMLNTLNNNCLLLDIDKEMIDEKEHLVAYNLERKYILIKLI